MKLGTLSLENNLILAPLLNVTTGPYRQFCRKINKIGLVSVPMLYTKRIEKNPSSVELYLHNIEEERPISIQLIGSNILTLKKSLDFLSSYKFDILDINAGCPSKRAIKAKEGGYLLKDLELLSSILDTAVKYSPQPVSLKIRTGFNYRDNLKNIIKVLKNSGIGFLIIHGRSIQAKFDSSMLNLDAIKEIKNALSIPIIGNGDIDNPIFAKEFLDYTNVDALMIGRGSMGNPEIFKQVDEYLTNSKLVTFENDLKKMEKLGSIYEKCIDEFLKESTSLHYTPEEYKFIELKRNIIWLTKGITDSVNIRIKIARTKNIYDLKEKLAEIYY
jgi:tRNA-dihydrouridine synthase B